MVSSVTSTTVNGDIAIGVVVVVAAGAVAGAAATGAVIEVFAGVVPDDAADGAVTRVCVLVELSPQPLIVTTAAAAAMRLQARRIIISS